MGASFVGVSTQYIVRLAWGQEVTVFAQNLGTPQGIVPGAVVALQWDPAHTFGLDASQSADDGATDVLAVATAF